MKSIYEVEVTMALNISFDFSLNIAVPYNYLKLLNIS